MPSIQDCCDFFETPDWSGLPRSEDNAERARLHPARFRKDVYYGRDGAVDQRGMTYRAIGTRLTEHYYQEEFPDGL